jgi:hypothetical protein
MKKANPNSILPAMVDRFAFSTIARHKPERHRSMHTISVAPCYHLMRDNLGFLSRVTAHVAWVIPLSSALHYLFHEVQAVYASHKIPFPSAAVRQADTSPSAHSPWADFLSESIASASTVAIVEGSGIRGDDMCLDLANAALDRMNYTRLAATSPTLVAFGFLFSAIEGGRMLPRLSKQQLEYLRLAQLRYQSYLTLCFPST